MLSAYLNLNVPKYSELLLQTTPSKAREFVAHYKVNPSALEHFNAQQLLENSDLWLVGTEEAKERDGWLQEAYPKQDTPDLELTESILTCGNCKQRKVDYYQKQTRGADEPMTCFCNCLNCGKRWVQ